MAWPDWFNITKPSEIIGFVNQNTEGWFGNIFLLIIFGVFFIGAIDRGYNTNKALAFSCLVTAISAVLSVILGMVANYWIPLAVALVIIGIVLLKKEESITA